MSTKNLLVELFVEELPPKALKKLGEAFAQLFSDGLKAQGLTTDHSAVSPFASKAEVEESPKGTVFERGDMLLEKTADLLLK